MIVNIEDVQRILRERDAVNALPFEEIKWYKDGKSLGIPKADMEDFKFMGMSNVAFVELGLFDEKNWNKDSESKL